MINLYLIDVYDPSIFFSTAYSIKRINYRRKLEVEESSLEAAHSKSQLVFKDRSASVGDIFEKDKKLYITMPVGFKLIEWGDVIDFTEQYKQ